MLLESRRSKHGLSANDPTKIHCHIEQAQRSLVVSCDSLGSGNEVEARSDTKKLVAQFGSWCKADF